MRDIFEEEKKLYKWGYKCVVGLDEAGRGPLAGPVAAAAVLMWRGPTSLRRSDLLKLNDIRDSKKLSERQREEWYKILTNHPGLEWAVALVYPKTIDRINIFEATKLAMRRAVKQIVRKMDKPIDCLIIDGNFNIYENRSRNKRTVLTTPAQKPIVKADEKVFSCIAASIIAKVTRDRIMRRAHKKYPQYGFAKHKGYGTKAHFTALKKYGPCTIHRRSFEPTKNL
jgi:ribonuclease HII